MNTDKTMPGKGSRLELLLKITKSIKIQTPCPEGRAIKPLRYE
jgi:hypothetical protein